MWNYRLSSLILIQLIIISIFLLCEIFDGIYYNEQSLSTKDSIKFIPKINETSNRAPLSAKYHTPTHKKIIKSRSFDYYFKEYKYVEHLNDSQVRKFSRVCFIEGTEDVNNSDSNGASKIENDETEISSCICKRNWHGEACSEPEIIWRAFVTTTSNQIISQTPRIAKKPNNIYYVISEITTINLETLKIQILELIEQVNLFILCDKKISDDPSISIRDSLDTGFLFKYREHILMIRDDNCKGANVYRQMKKILKSQIRFTDVFIYGKSDEILNRKAIQYLKWHKHWPQPLKFRLKWNVYGFFYQHPDNTVIKTIACQINVIEQFYSSDPDLMSASTKSALIVGDLNHYGGWFCEFCYQPIEVLRKFHLNRRTTLNNTIIDPLKSQQGHNNEQVINISYIEKLISQGIYVDGKLQLMKYHNYHNSKYFMPESVANNRMEFENIVTNFYSLFNDNYESDEY